MKEMMKQKMMNRFHKRNSSSSSSLDFKSGERLDFKFSSLQALQVPSGWDKLTLSLIAIETDKTVSKTGKASVWNGNCRWTETLTESIWVSPEDPSKDLRQYLYKLLISKGSTRSSILGEITVNLSSYLSSETSLPVAIPLKKCDHGTILQVAIQCLTPRANSRWSDTTSIPEDVKSEYSDLDNVSDAADGLNTKRLESSTSSSILDTSHTRGLSSRDTSISTVRSHRSFDSMDDSFGRESAHSNLSEVTIDPIGKQESTLTQSSTFHSSVNVYDSPRSSHSPFSLGSGKNLLNRRHESAKVSHTVPASPLRSYGSSEFVLDSECSTPEEVRAEARKWERDARKLMVDLDLSRKETCNQTRNLENATMQLSALQTECNGLKQEIKHLKVLLGESEAKERDADELKVQVRDKKDMQAELEEEVKFLKGQNDDLALQLNKTQESNLELVDVLQELEETIEKQRLEIKSLEASERADGDIGIKVNCENEDNGLVCKLEIELQKFQESQKNLESRILYLEETLEEKTREIELERDLKTRTLMDVDSEMTKKLSLKDNEIVNLKAKLAEAVAAPVFKETESIESQDLIEENKALKDKVMELEKDCNELTDENLDLHLKLRESNKDLPRTEGSEEVKNTKLDDIASKYLQIRCNDLESKCTELGKELLVKTSEIEGHKSGCLLKEAQLSDLQIINTQLEESLKAMEKEVSDLKECHISSSKVLEKKLLELESHNQELELHLAELEEDNLHLSGRISGLEPQLRYLTDEKESTRLEAEHSESRITSLQDEIKKLEDEVEMTKVDMRQKVEDMQKRWLEAQEECEYLKKANPKLQTTTENLMEECSSLQKSNSELRQQRLELHNRCGVLETKLMESQDNYLKLSKNLENLEEKLTSMLDEIVSKEKTFNSELDGLVLQFKEQTEKYVDAESLLNKMYSEKVIEVENAKKEVEQFSSQISATHDERDKMASEAILEMHVLRADKDKLEKAISEVEEKLRSSDMKLDNIQVEYEKRILDLTNELSTFKQNYGVLAANHEKLIELLENTRSNEEKLKNTVSELSATLTSCEYQIVQLTEENTSLKVQLEKIPLLQDEIVSLKNSLNDVKFENERLEASLQMISGDYEQLKEEKTSLLEKASSMQKAVIELEDHKRSKISLEEKVLRLQGDLTAREALGAQDAELKNEIGRLKRSNSQLQWKINRLQEEKDEYAKKTEAIKENEFGSSDSSGSLHEDTADKVDESSRIKTLEIELAEALEANEMYKVQIKSFLSEEQVRKTDIPVELEVKDEGFNEENNKREASLEAELNELQERYLNMSLKYAEVEAQREELVLKLKAVGPGRSWFS